MILRTIKCSRCNAEEKEKGFGDGWPGWGSVQGIKNEETGETEAHICPECLSKIKALLNDEEGRA